jgi:hypothetical protein
MNTLVGVSGPLPPPPVPPLPVPPAPAATALPPTPALAPPLAAPAEAAPPVPMPAAAAADPACPTAPPIAAPALALEPDAPPAPACTTWVPPVPPPSTGSLGTSTEQPTQTTVTQRSRETRSVRTPNTGARAPIPCRGSSSSHVTIPAAPSPKPRTFSRGRRAIAGRVRRSPPATRPPRPHPSGAQPRTRVAATPARAPLNRQSLPARERPHCDQCPPASAHCASRPRCPQP